MQFMDIFKMKFNEILNDSFMYIASWFNHYPTAKVSISPTILIIGMLLIIIVLSSAFLSAELAEKRRKGCLANFSLGLLIPWIYPIILKSIPIKHL